VNTPSSLTDGLAEQLAQDEPPSQAAAAAAAGLAEFGSPLSKSAWPVMNPVFCTSGARDLLTAAAIVHCAANATPFLVASRFSFQMSGANGSLDNLTDACAVGVVLFLIWHQISADDWSDHTRSCKPRYAASPSITYPSGSASRNRQTKTK